MLIVEDSGVNENLPLICQCGHSTKDHIGKGVCLAFPPDIGIFDPEKYNNYGSYFCKCNKFEPQVLIPAKENNCTGCSHPMSIHGVWGCLHEVSYHPDPDFSNQTYCPCTKSDIGIGIGSGSGLGKSSSYLTSWQEPSLTILDYDSVYGGVSSSIGLGKTVPYLYKPSGNDRMDATTWMKTRTGIKEMSVNGHDVAILLAEYAKLVSKDLEDRIDSIVAERVGLAKKEHRIKCIPSFKKSGRKFRKNDS